MQNIPYLLVFTTMLFVPVAMLTGIGKGMELAIKPNTSGHHVRSATLRCVKIAA